MSGTSHATVAPSAREAIYIPLGVRQHKSEQWIYLRVAGEVRGYRPSQAMGLGFLMSIYPDAHHWRRNYPTQWRGNGVDTLSAVAHIIRQCRRAGTYDPVTGITTPPSD